MQGQNNGKFQSKEILENNKDHIKLVRFELLSVTQSPYAIWFIGRKFFTIGKYSLG